MSIIADGSLNDEDLDQLEDLLTKNGSTGMTLERMDGYLSALACLPDFVMPSDYLPSIFGDSPQFEDAQTAERAVGLILRYWNAIIVELRQGLNDPQKLRYPFLQDYKGAQAGYEWVCGFMKAAIERHDQFKEIVNSDEHGGMILPMMMLSHERDENPETRTPTIPPDKRDEILAIMIAGLNQIYRHFEPRRLSGVSRRVQKSSHKTGRNEACPCGSGKKFKHCCLGSAVTVH